MSFFGVDIPESSEIVVKLRFIAGRGKPFVAWEGPADANEADVLAELCKSPLVCAYIKRAAGSGRLKPDDDGSYHIHAKVICYESGQMIDEKSTEVTVYPLDSSAGSAEGGDAPALLVIRTLVESLTQREEHLQRIAEQVNRMHESYEKAVHKISQHSLQAMDKVSGHAATAFAAAAAPFADMSKSLVKALDDSRTHSSTTAKESQDLLIEALKNRIIESNQVSKPSIAQDIKDVMQLWPMFKGFLGEIDPKPQT